MDVLFLLYLCHTKPLKTRYFAIYQQYATLLRTICEVRFCFQLKMRTKCELKSMVGFMLFPTFAANFKKQY